jgi:hypothetical protein
MSRKSCRSCGSPLTNARRFDAQFCSHKCRQREYRRRVASGWGTDPRRPSIKPPGGPDLAEGRRFLRKHDLQAAQACFERALAADEDALGPDHPAVAFDRYELGETLIHLGRLDEGKEQLLLAQAIAEGSSEYPGSVSVLERVNPALRGLDNPLPFEHPEFQARLKIPLQVQAMIDRKTSQRESRRSRAEPDDAAPGSG